MEKGWGVALQESSQQERECHDFGVREPAVFYVISLNISLNCIMFIENDILPILGAFGETRLFYE